VIVVGIHGPNKLREANISTDGSRRCAARHPLQLDEAARHSYSGATRPITRQVHSATDQVSLRTKKSSEIEGEVL
jgi:hypothetical protein